MRAGQAAAVAARADHEGNRFCVIDPPDRVPDD